MPALAYLIRDRGAKGVYLRISLPGRKPVEKYCGMGVDGVRLAAERKAELEQAARDERVWHEDSRPLPIDALTRSWRDVHGGTQSWRWQQTAEARVERIARWFGPRDLRELTENDLREAAGAWLKDGLSGWTVAGHLSILRRIYRLAVDAGLFQPRGRVPFHAVIRDVQESTQPEAKTRDAWTPAEVAEIMALAAKHDRLGPLLAFLFATGCRRGEALGLRWEDVDFERGRIHIRRVPTGEKVGKTKRPKTKSSVRLIPLTAGLRSVLETLRRSRLPTDWVFPGLNGGAWEEHTMERCWARLRKRAQVRGVRPLPLHCTRHTATTTWLTQGVSLKRVSEWTGDSVQTLQKHYAHVLPLDAEPPDLLAGLPTVGGGETVGVAARNVVIREGFEPSTPSFGGSRRKAEKLK